MDLNAIITESMQNRTAGEMVRAYKVLLQRLKNVGIKPKKHILDNEISVDLKQAIHEEEITYEIVPKGQQRRNIAENSIGTWKSTAVRVFSVIDSKCPLYLWDLMLRQIDMQVNLQRQSNTTPKVSAHAHLYRAHDFNQHPLAPLDIAVHIYVAPGNRKTWSIKTKKGCYVSTSLERYRYYMAYCSKTQAV